MKGNRRQFLHALGGAGVAIVAAHPSRRPAYAQKNTEPIRATDLRNGLLQITGVGGNVIVLPKAEGLLMVDSGAPEHGQAVRHLVAARFGAAPTGLLFNTHWHLDHTGGNEALIQEGTTVVAHEHTRLWMATKFYVEWEDRRYSPRPPGALPNKTFFSSDPQPLEVAFGGERVVYGHLVEAHTDGDIYVWFPERNVIVAGGAVTARTYPVLDYITGGWVGGMMDATRTLIEMSDGDTLIIPESGPPQTRADLEIQHQMLDRARQGVEAMATKGQGIDEMIAARLTKDFEDRYGTDTALFISNMYEGMWWSRMRTI